MIKRLERWILHLHSHMASLTDTQGNAKDRISNTVSYSVQFTYNSFCSPHAWNRATGLVEFGESKWNWRGKFWQITTFISLIVTMTQILMEIRYTLFLHEDESNVVLFRRIQILGSSSVLIAQLNTVWKIKEYKEFINQFLQLLRKVEQDHVLPAATLNRIFWVTRILTIFYFLMVLYLPIAFVIFVAYPEVDPNLFSELLPGVFNQTSVAGRREHWDPFVAFAVGVLEFTVFSQQCCHALNYGSFITIGAISGIQLLQEMKSVIARSQDNLNSTLLDMDYFIKLYKALYLGCNRLNDWIASIVIPSGSSILVATIVSMNYTLITTTTNGFQTLTLLAGVFVVALFIYICYQTASCLSFRSKECLRAMAVRRVVLESKYNSRRLRGCTDCRIYFGSMFYLEQTTVLKLGHIIVDYTNQAVLTFP